MKRIQVLSSTVWRTLWIVVVHFAVNQTDPCQPTEVRWMRPDRQRELPGSAFLAYCVLPKKKTSVWSPRLVIPSGLDSCDDWHTFVSCLFFLLLLFFVQYSSRWLKCCPVYIYSSWLSHSSPWNQFWEEHLALVQNCWWNTTNRLQHPKQGHLESNQQCFWMRVPSMCYLDHCFSSALGSRLVWMSLVCIGCLVSKVKAFVLQ